MNDFSDDIATDESPDRLSIYQEIHLELFRRQIDRTEAPELRKMLIEISRLMLLKDNIFRKILKDI